MPMCNDYEQHVRYAELCEMMQALELGLPERQSEADLPQESEVLAPLPAGSLHVEQVRAGFD